MNRIERGVGISGQGSTQQTWKERIPSGKTKSKCLGIGQCWRNFVTDPEEAKKYIKATIEDYLNAKETSPRRARIPAPVRVETGPPHEILLRCER